MDEFIEGVLEREGYDKYTNHPQDPGAATRWGITLGLLRSAEWLGDVDGDGDIDEDDVRHLPKDVAIEVYRRKKWRPQYEEMPRLIAEKTFDLAVNMGAKQSHLLLQRALCCCGEMVADDGIVGPKTLGAIAEVRPMRLRCAQRAQAEGFYRLLVTRNSALRARGAVRPNGKEYPDLSVFLSGWVKRARW